MRKLIGSLTLALTLAAHRFLFHEYLEKQMATVENGDVRTHYEWSGSDDGEVLVFANSLGSDLHMWDKVLPSLENRYRILRYDMRGHGKSSIPPGLYTTAQL